MNLAELKSEIASIVTGMWGAELDHERFAVTFATESAFGDVAVNAAMIYARELGRQPRELASELAMAIEEIGGVAKVEVAGPGFINIWFSDQSLWKLAQKAGDTRPVGYRGLEVVAEYGDPNPFKVLHAGHLYTSVVGDAIANLLELAGGNVHRVNFGGDVGLHVGRTMWAILNQLGGERPEGLAKVPEPERSEWMARCYVEGTRVYEEDPKAKQEMIDLNRKVYQIHADSDRTSALAQIYWTCRKWSYDYFEQFYASIGTKFEKVYPESAVAELGLKTVKEQLEAGVFEKSDGAVVFNGEKYGLHTRVFVNSQGIPTYEAKDVGLIMQKWDDFHFDKSVVITGNEQEQYMAVVLKAVEQFAPKLVAATSHLTHGLVKLQGGVKMSSRKGNILRAVDVIMAAEAAHLELIGKDNRETVLGAIKYAFLKKRMGGDLSYDPKDSVSLEGNSGPYLQYAHARARSILAKVSKKDKGQGDNTLTADERLLARNLTHYSEVVQQAVDEMSPHLVCTYLYNLAQGFNRFYETNRVIGDPREAKRLELVEAYADVLRSGLDVLGVPAPEKL